MSSSLLECPPKGVTTADELLRTYSRRHGEWCIGALAGRYVELTGKASSAVFTAARGMVLEAQMQGGLVAWVGKRSPAFFPPDFAAVGIDLEALLVAFVDSLNEALRVVDLLLRSDAFSLLVLDLGEQGALPLAVQSRFSGLAKEHYTAFLEITCKNRHSRGSLASLRLEAKRIRADREHFIVEVCAIKDKQSAPGWKHSESCYGPNGVR